MDLGRHFWQAIAIPQECACVVKQLKLAGNLTASELEAQKLFEREAEVLEEIGNKHRPNSRFLCLLGVDSPRTTCTG